MPIQAIDLSEFNENRINIFEWVAHQTNRFGDSVGIAATESADDSGELRSFDLFDDTGERRLCHAEVVKHNDLSYWRAVVLQTGKQDGVSWDPLPVVFMEHFNPAPASSRLYPWVMYKYRADGTPMEVRYQQYNPGTEGQTPGYFKDLFLVLIDEKGYVSAVLDQQSERTRIISPPILEGNSAHLQGYGSVWEVEANSENFRIEEFLLGHPAFKVKLAYSNEMVLRLHSYGALLKPLLEVISNEYAALTPISTVNFHVNEACNMKCKHCFSEFEEIEHQVSTPEAIEIVGQIKDLPGIKKVNISGGEPTLFPGLQDLIKEAKRLGYMTSMVSNGYNFIRRGEKFRIQDFQGKLDMIALSLDGFDESINLAIGRSVGQTTLSFDELFDFTAKLHQLGIRLKINTVVTEANHLESMFTQIARLNPIRWKILRALPVVGQNTAQKVFVTSDQYDLFVSTNKTGAEAAGIKVVCEDNVDMTGSYIMIAPDGRFFNNVNGTHAFSDPILKVGIKAALATTPFFRERFFYRDGCYDS